MEQNYYWGRNPPKINAMLAALAWNFKKMMKKLKDESKKTLLHLLRKLFWSIKFKSIRTS